MKIGELAKASGVPAHTIRFYESKGLMPKVTRGMNGYRVYNEESLERLGRITCAKRLGFTLEDMLTVLAESNPSEGLDHDKLIQQLDTRLDEVETMMKGLMQQREEIVQFKQHLLDTWSEGKCVQADGINFAD